MGKMAQLWNLLRKGEVNETSTEQNIIEKFVPVFDKKYKTVVEVDHTAHITEMIYWLHENCNGSVDVVYSPDVVDEPKKVFFGFENKDDALIFRIKFSL